MLKNRLKVISIFICIMLLLNVFTACGTKEKESVAVKENLSAKEEKVESKEVAKSEEKVDLSTKKVVIINDLQINGEKKDKSKMIDIYVKNGCKKENIFEFDTDPSEVDKIDSIVNKIKDIDPDVIHYLFGVPGPLRSAISSMEIPIVVGSVAEMDCDENGVPRGNVTGFKSIPSDAPERLYKMLNDITPIGDKKAVFINVSNAPQFNEEIIKNALKKINVELKEYNLIETSQETLEAASKYAKDNEVGWVLIGIPPADSGSNFFEIVEKIVKITKKPSAVFYEEMVASGALCGVSIDDEKGFLIEPTEIGLEILKGKNVKEIKMKDHKYINIILNKYTADVMNVKFPDNILEAAYRVYTDYDNNYAGTSK